MSNNGITQFLPRLLPCRGFAQSHKTSRVRDSCVLYFVSWNDRTLVDEGSIETAGHSCDVSVVDEWKIDQVTSELDALRILL